MTRRVAISVALVVLIAAVYGQVREFGFVAYDDNAYVYENEHVRAGLTAAGAAWALTTLHASNWHPLTWISHMADVSMFGLDAGRHHLVSVAWHAANAVLLFLLLEGATGAPWRSAFVAALFAVHPVHVESVAWIAERKDVLSAFLAMLTIAAYARYTRRPGPGRMAAVAVLFALGLAAKPMLVTLPFALLLLDVWPLGRVGPEPVSRAELAPLVKEKLPLFALAAASSALTVLAQARGGAMTTVEALPPGTRLAHAAVSYAEYFVMLLWPRDLAVFYPHPGVGPEGIPAWEIAASIAALAGLTWLALRNWRRRPAPAAGWLWYLGTLVPVIGLVQVGHQGMADRYTYLPSIGIFVAVAWALPDAAPRARAARGALAAAAAVAVAALAFAAHAQAATWRSSETLFRHAAEATAGNWLAWKNLGVELFRRGEVEPARDAFERSLRFRADDPDTWMNLALCNGALNRHQAAAESLRRALKLRPGDEDAWFNLGVAYALLGRTDGCAEAVDALRRLSPERAAELEQRIAELTPSR